MNNNQDGMRAVICIVPSEREQKLKAAFTSLNIPIYYQCRGVGTAPSEILDILGMGGTGRMVSLSIMQKSRVNGVFRALDKAGSFWERGGGIGFSVVLTGAQMQLITSVKEKSDSVKENREEDKHMSDNNTAYSLIWVSVARGFTEEVVHAAREAGARGGTLIKGSRTCEHDVAANLGISEQDEQEFVVILAEKDKKHGIMTAIADKCGLSTEVHGIVVSLPVDEVMGLK